MIFVNKPFYRWCQKVLPLVYDESLSYYELLCKVLAHLNMAIEDINELKQIVAGGVDVEKLVEEAVDKMVIDGTMDEIVARAVGTFANGVTYTSYPIFDFTDFAKELHDKYADTDLEDWNTNKVRILWQGLVDTHPKNMFYGDAFLVSSDVYSPYYVWKARKNYQTTHFGERLNGKTKYGMFANETGGEPTFLITMGQRGGDKLPNAVFYNLFKAWTEGKYNGKYILDNYNFIIVPILNYEEFNTNSFTDSIRHKFKNQYENYSSNLPINDRIEAFFASGIKAIIEDITKEDIEDYELWKFNQRVVHFNIDVFTWGGTGDDEDEFNHGIVYRGHTIRENNSEEILFDGSMNAIEQIKKEKPELFADEITSQVHIGNNSYHSVISCSSQNGYKGVNFEMPARVGADWESYTGSGEERNTENSFYLSLVGFYNALIGGMKYLEKDVERIYPDFWSLGAWMECPDTSIDETDGSLIGPYRAIDIDEIIKRVPPGSLCNLGVRQITYGDNQYLDMGLLYQGLPSMYSTVVEGQTVYTGVRGGVLTINRGSGNESLEYEFWNRRGRAEYTPYWNEDRWFYCKFNNYGQHNEWCRMQSKTIMEFCIAKSDGATVSTTANEITKIPLENNDSQWSTVNYFGVSDGGIHIKKHGLYMVWGGAQITVDGDCTGLNAYVVQGTSSTGFDGGTAIAGEGCPQGTSGFTGGIALVPRIVEIPAERWIYLGVKTVGDGGTVTRNGANTYLQALLIEEL